MRTYYIVRLDGFERHDPSDPVSWAPGGPYLAVTRAHRLDTVVEIRARSRREAIEQFSAEAGRK